MADFTPGPWHVVEEYDGSRTVAIMRDFRRGVSPGFHVTANFDWVGRARPEQVEANARLIAAAPELLLAARLAALNFKRALASDSFLGDDDHEAWNALNTAIAKAEGR